MILRRCLNACNKTETFFTWKDLAQISKLPIHCFVLTSIECCNDTCFNVHRNWVVTPTRNPKPIFGDLAHSSSTK